MNTFFTIAGIVLFIEAISFYMTDRDTTDAPKKKWWHWWGGESGLRVYVDQATGVHYVKSSLFDKLQVRINKDGTLYTGE
jgi:uncharacterized membrane protein YdcZ (DUF606 family)